VRQAKEARERTELDLARVREELKLHKLQLVVAQSGRDFIHLTLVYQCSNLCLEIDRAQRIVAEVERARVAAEERSNRDRDRVRRFAAERAVEIAKQEGRNEGWRQGLERGKWVAWAEVQRREMAEYDDDEEERSLTPPPRHNRASNHTPRYITFHQLHSFAFFVDVEDPQAE
jgi:flagellar biosynthesis/type III secretory pathway protein FliH